MPNAPPKYMHVLVFFDLPVHSRAARKEYARFRKFLITEGFDMLQFSVYDRLVAGPLAAKRMVESVMSKVPPDGMVRALPLTDKDYGRMVIAVGPKTEREKIVTGQQLILL